MLPGGAACSFAAYAFLCDGRVGDQGGGEQIHVLDCGPCDFAHFGRIFPFQDLLQDALQLDSVAFFDGLLSFLRLGKPHLRLAGGSPLRHWSPLEYLRTSLPENRSQKYEFLRD